MVSGFGLGLRPRHYPDFADGSARVDWVEIVSENFMVPGGRPLAYLDAIRARYPIVMHGVSLSIGGWDPLDERYLDALWRLAERVQPAWISDHLCWTGMGGVNLHDLLPLPFTAEALAHVARRVSRVQDRLRRPLVIENVSAYVRLDGDLEECQFLAELAGRTGCELLLDVNNVHVSAANLGFDAAGYIDALPARAIRQIHVAGHTRQGDLLIDTHDEPVPDPVWDLYEHAIARLGPVPTMIERDDAIPPLEELEAELGVARMRQERALQARRPDALAA